MKTPPPYGEIRGMDKIDGMLNEFFRRLAEDGCENAYVVFVSKFRRNIYGNNDFIVEVPVQASGLGCGLFIYFIKVRSVTRWMSPSRSNTRPATYMVRCDNYRWLYTVNISNHNLVDSRVGLSEYLNWKIAQMFKSVPRGILDAVDLNLSVRGVLP